MGNMEYGCFWSEELYNYDNVKVPIINHFLYKNDVMCISSRPGQGKSILAKQLMFSLTTGHPFLNLYEVSRPQYVLYIQTEGDRAETIQRIHQMKAGLQIDDSMWAHINLDGAIINTQAGIKHLIELARKPMMPFGVIIIDPLYTTVKGTLNSDEVATDWVRNARKLKGEFGAAIIVLHHDSKVTYNQKGNAVDKGDDNIFGSVYWSAFFNTNFKLKKVKDTHVLQRGKQRSGEITDVIEMKLVEPNPLMFIENDPDMIVSEISLQTIMKGENVRMTAKQLMTKLGRSQATTYRLLKKMVKAGSVSNTLDGRVSYYEWVR